LYARVIVWFVRYVDRVDVPDDALRRALATTPVFAIRALASDVTGRPGG